MNFATLHAVYSRLFALGLLFHLFVSPTAALAFVQPNVGSNSNSTTLNGHQQRPDRITLLKNAVKEWKESDPGLRVCDHRYFDTSDDDNVKASSAFKWYKEELQRLVQKYPSEYEKYGETKFFSVKMLHRDNMKCSVMDRGCNNKPVTCSDIVPRVQKANPDASLEEVFDISRKLFIISERFDELFKTMDLIDNLLTKTQTRLAAEAGEIVMKYTTHADPDAEVACAWIKAGIDTIVESISTGLSLGSGNGMFNGVKDAALKKNLEGVMGSMFPYMISAINRISNNVALTEEAKRELIEAILNDKDLHMSHSYLEGVCSLEGGGMKNEDFQRFVEMSKHMAQAFADIRKGFEEMTNFITEHKDTTLEDSPLATFLEVTDYQDAVSKLKGGTAKYEDAMAQRFREKYMSYAYASSHCQVTCTYAPNAAKQKEYCETSWWNGQSRFCPADTDKYKNVVCQVACWTAKHLDNRWRPLIGEAFLEGENLNVTQVVSKTWDSYLKHGAGGTSAVGVAGDISSLNAMLSNTSSAIDLPLCLSNYTDLQDYDKSRYSGGTDAVGRNKNQNFPCSCGSFQAEDTRRFMERLGYAPHQHDWLNRKNHETFQTLCPWNIRKIPPYNHFKALCELGIRHPLKSDKNDRFDMRRGPNPRCANISEETVGMSEREANRHFCYISDEAKMLFKEERRTGSSLTAFWSKSHSRMCQNWAGALWASDDSSMPRGWKREFKKLQPPPGFDIQGWVDRTKCQFYGRLQNATNGTSNSSMLNSTSTGTSQSNPVSTGATTISPVVWMDGDLDDDSDLDFSDSELDI
ncbi:hypothetical protein EG329_013482 [Mollisiaceae sp. DMI_Dod_QoI]|nr:hypothetical protein EG329_013482 [Helotiales sp. DMI_Dod_QoI]